MGFIWFRQDAAKLLLNVTEYPVFNGDAAYFVGCRTEFLNFITYDLFFKGLTA
jgi:hypothetical protein